MNEQRLKAYYQLIESLLNCPDGEEPEILAANTELLDAGFLQVLTAVADDFAQQGEENTAEWLRNLATYLTTPETTPITQEDIETYGQFLLEILQATAESNGDAEVIYPLLAANTDKLNHIFAELLRGWATNTLAEAEPDTATSIAADIGNFSNLIQQFPLGSKASNMEIAIAGYEIIALTVYTRSAFPVNWATLQNNLATAYGDRIFGERAENIELAIAAYSAALSVRTRSAFPVDWAMTQNNLGLAYHDRIFGERAENIELAIAAYGAALKVLIRTDFPVDWAMTQNHLGNAYSERIFGERAENIELAIAAYRAALKVLIRTDFPQDWAGTQNNLGNAYSHRILGERAENIELAIAAYRAALKVLIRTDFPVDWAMTQNNLGNAYRDRIFGERAENIELAIAAYGAALEVYTRRASPENWAMTQNHLGNAYSERILGERAENIELAITTYRAALEVLTRTAFPEKWAMTQNNLGSAISEIISGETAENLKLAIAAFSAALEVYTRSAFPENWATTQNNLGNAYSNRILREQAENIELAIAAYGAALEVYTHKAFPQDWAMTQNHLGNAYLYRISGERAENIELAIAAYGAALEVRTRTAFPQNNAETLFNLGILYQDEKQFYLAYKTFSTVIETVESLRGEIISGHQSKRKQAEEWNQVYVRIVEVCLELGNITAAIEYVERSKTRNLVELILDRDRKTIFPQEIVSRLEQLRDKITRGQYQLQNGNAENSTALAEHLQQLQQQRQELEDNHLPVGFGFQFDQFQKTLNDSTAMIEWYITREKIIAFVVKYNGQELIVWQSKTEDREALVDWVIGYLQEYYTQKDQWQNQLEERLKKLAEILHIEEILAQLPKECDRLILIPHRFLHLFPLHALPVKESYLLELFPNGVGYAPSCQLLQQVQLRQRPDFQSFFAIQNPTEDLFYADVEIESIQHYFPIEETTILRGKDANRNALDTIIANLAEVNCLHFSCHGSFNLKTPADSYLRLNGAIVNEKLDLDKCLTLGDLFNKDFNLDQCRLVVLSACETGMIDFDNTSDEYIGLPSGFLYAGSSSVVSSLWKVDQVSTALLFIKFYENLQNYPELKQGDIAIALNEALIWLRNLTTQEGKQFLQQVKPYIDVVFQGKKDIIKKSFIKGVSFTLESNPQPFANPFYWAAFTAIGY